MDKDFYCDIVADNWFKGTYNSKEFTAHVFEESSKFGIDNGKISKLCITDSNGDFLVNYDRGWDVKPTEFVVDDYKDIVSYLEELDIANFIKNDCMG